MAPTAATADAASARAARAPAARGGAGRGRGGRRVTLIPSRAPGDYSTLIRRASVYEMTTWSPGLTFLRRPLSSTMKLWVWPSSVCTVTEGAFMSTALTRTVTVCCWVIDALGFGVAFLTTAGSSVFEGGTGSPGLRIW